MEKTILGLQIQALRKDKGITQEELGKEQREKTIAGL